MKYKGMKKGLSIALCILAVAAFVASGSFYRVGQGEEALVITLGRVLLDLTPKPIGTIEWE